MVIVCERAGAETKICVFSSFLKSWFLSDESLCENWIVPLFFQHSVKWEVKQKIVARYWSRFFLFFDVNISW